MIVRPTADGQHWHIEMVHHVNVSKQNAILNFRQYLQEILGEFEQEIARTVHPMIPPTSSHLIVDNNGNPIEKVSNANQ